MLRHATLWVLVLTAGFGLAETGSSAESAESRAAIDGDIVPGVEARTVHMTTNAWNRFYLGRAVAEWADGDLHRARDFLLRCDLSSPGTFADADRAAFLLAHVQLRLHDRDGFLELARSVSRWPQGSPFTEWIGYQLVVTQGQDHAPSAIPWRSPAPGLSGWAVGLLGPRLQPFPHAETLVAELLIREGNPAGALQFLSRTRTARSPLSERVAEALARQALGTSAISVWRTIAETRTDLPHEKDLAAMAAMRVAEELLAEGESPEAILDAIDPNSRFYARAVHVRARYRAEQGDHAGAERLLREIWATHRRYRDRSQVGLYLGAEAMDRGTPEDAHLLYETLDREWQAEQQGIEQFRTPEGRRALWTRWEEEAYWPNSLGLDLSALWESSRDLSTRALDLRTIPSLTVPGTMTSLTPPGESGAPWIPGPMAEERDSLAATWAEVTATRARLDAMERALLDRKEDLRRSLAYRHRGMDRAGDELSELGPQAMGLDSLIANLDDLLARMERLKNDAADRFSQRTRNLLERARVQHLWIQALQHFYSDSPGTSTPQGETASRTLLAEEEALSRTLQSWTATLQARVPGLLDGSFAEVWAPGLETQARDLRDRAAAQRRRLAGITDSLRAGMDRFEHDDGIAALQDSITGLIAQSDSLQQVFDDQREAIAETCVRRALAAHGEVREAIDYGLMASAYESHKLRSDADAADSLGHVYRREATARHTAFLESYPQSLARGEARFRLADLLLVEAQEQFNQKMQAFLSDSLSTTGRSNRAFVPFVNYEPALVLYRNILAEDSTYAHRDAVLFNLGMILSDQGSFEATTHLQALVRDYPSSPFNQEAHLRLGDEQFDRLEFATSIPLYEEAVAGEEVGLRAIALYRIGWAHFSLDRYREAADAFRRLMDLYAEQEENEEDIELKTDLRPEAEDYLIHALARGGGAPVFAEYFDGIGRREYEDKILQGMAVLYQEFSQFAEAIEADAMFLERYPTYTRALDSARRIVASYDDWHHPQQAREARRRYARLFLPGTPWHSAATWNRQEGEDFARDCYKHLAVYHHQRAQKQPSLTADWREALDLYETLIQHWPTHKETAKFHLYAGESASQLKLYETAVGHYRVAAAQGRHSFDDPELSRSADWQLLAVTDTWYMSTVTLQDDGTRRGRDDLASAVRDAAAAYINEHYHDERVPEVLWRRGTVAYAHKWYVVAAGDFADLVERFPQDKNTPQAAALQGDALYHTRQFDLARTAYEAALVVAEAAGVDSLTRRIRPIIPVCAYRHAEAVAKEDTKHPENGAALFAEVATTWPEYEHAGRAWYQAGLGYQAAGQTVEAVAAFNHLIDGYPQHEFVRDAHLQIAKAWEASEHPQNAALAYRRISLTYPDDADAGGALLKAVELMGTAGEAGQVDTLRAEYLERFPEDVETGMSFLEDFATRELDGMVPDQRISTLLGTGKKPVSSRLRQYLKIAESHPDFASPQIVARVQFLKGEELFAPYAALPLTLPIDKSIAAKKQKLEGVLSAYGECGKIGVAEYARAAAFRIGEALIRFGESLENSERPQMGDEDLAAYEEVLLDEAWTFFDRGEAAWSDLIRETRTIPEDPGGWIAATRDALWPRLGEKFLFMPEVEYPVITAVPTPVAKPADDHLVRASEGNEPPAPGPEEKE